MWCKKFVNLILKNKKGVGVIGAIAGMAIGSVVAIGSSFLVTNQSIETERYKSELNHAQLKTKVQRFFVDECNEKLKNTLKHSGNRRGGVNENLRNFQKGQNVSINLLIDDPSTNLFNPEINCESDHDGCTASGDNKTLVDSNRQIYSLNQINFFSFSCLDPTGCDCSSRGHDYDSLGECETRRALNLYTTSPESSSQSISNVFSIPFFVEYSGPGLENFECFLGCAPIKCTSDKYYQDTDSDGCYECQECPLGHQVNEAQTECEPCPPGEYKDTDNGFCKECPTGTYAPSSGTTECLDCTGGRVINADKTSCDCPTAGDTWNGSSCVPCSSPPICEGDLDPRDTNGDGCNDTCECPEGTNWDGLLSCIPCSSRPTCEGGRVIGCPGRCECPPGKSLSGGVCSCDFSPICDSDQRAVDNNGDGCNDTCECPDFRPCPDGQFPEDSNSGGCNDICVPSCTPSECDSDQRAVDTNGDGCNDTCKCSTPPISCGAGVTPVDKTPNGCGGRCPSSPPCTESTCPSGQRPVDNGDVGDCKDNGCECVTPSPTCTGRQVLVGSDSLSCGGSCQCRSDQPTNCPEGKEFKTDTNGCNYCQDIIINCTPSVCDSGKRPVDNGDGCKDDGCECENPSPTCEAHQFLEGAVNGCGGSCEPRLCSNTCPPGQSRQGTHEPNCNCVCDSTTCPEGQTTDSYYETSRSYQDDNGATCVESCLPMECDNCPAGQKQVGTYPNCSCECKETSCPDGQTQVPGNLADDNGVTCVDSCEACTPSSSTCCDGTIAEEVQPPFSCDIHYMCGGRIVETVDGGVCDLTEFTTGVDTSTVSGTGQGRWVLYKLLSETSDRLLPNVAVPDQICYQLGISHNHYLTNPDSGRVEVWQIRCQ